MNKAPISEIFYSVQGEGIFVGVPQIFVRFAGCNLKKCAFCDETAEYKASNTIEQVISRIEKLNKRTRVHSISLTGGEPLLYPDFLKKLCVKLKKRKFLIYLETNGTLPENLKQVKKYIDFVAMDIKLPTSTGLGSFFKQHRQFIEAASSKKIFVKVVVSAKTTLSCYKKAVDLVNRTNPAMPFVIQPVTEMPGVVGTAREEKILLFCAYALKFLKDVRIIAQMHRKLGVK